MRIPSADHDLDSFIQYVLDHQNDRKEHEAESWEGLRAICVLTSRLDWIESFLVRGRKNVKQFGDIFEITLPYIDRFENQKEAVYYAHYDHEKGMTQVI
ncbi:MAG: hypothetical protein WBA22_03890 [Candidatus Methanofastidiosia archaeon]